VKGTCKVVLVFKYHIMNMYRAVEVELHGFLISESAGLVEQVNAFNYL